MYTGCVKHYMFICHILFKDDERRYRCTSQFVINTHERNSKIEQKNVNRSIRIFLAFLELEFSTVKRHFFKTKAAAGYLLYFIRYCES